MTGWLSQASLIYWVFNLNVFPADFTLSPDNADNSISCQQSGEWIVFVDRIWRQHFGQTPFSGLQG